MNGRLALECWREAVEAFGTLGRDVAGIVFHSDQDPVFTSYDWLWALAVDSGVRISYSERGAWDNPRIESLWSRLKTENMDLYLDAQDWWTFEVSSMGKCSSTTASGDTRARATGHHWPA